MNLRKEKNSFKEIYSNKRWRLYINIVVACILFFAILLIAMRNSKDVSLKATEYEHTVIKVTKDDETNQALDETDLSDEGDQTNGISVLIDPGHGGYDPGCNFGEHYESNITLEIALKLRNQLTDRGYEVIMTREDDTGINLENRSGLIQTYSPDFFVSIHLNALDNDTVTHGIETWYYDQISSACVVFAEYIQQGIIQETNSKDRGVKKDALRVLKSIECPGVLVEAGFLSSIEERELLIDARYQESIAIGIANGIEAYIAAQSVLNE